jgi:murein L,D-transpeptidase YafK
MRRLRRRLLLGAMFATAAGVGVFGRRHLALGVARAKDSVGPADRVAAARARIGAVVREKVVAAGVPWPPRELYLRATKHDAEGGRGAVEVWGGDGRGPLRLVVRHPLCALSGALGPKRREGDLQIPEGYYRVSALNPRSSYHLSLRVDYPNASDRIRNRRLDATAPLGGDIMVHGSCVTIGCLPIEDGPIEEVYLLVSELFPDRTVPIHIFPRPLDDAGLAALLTTSPSPEVRMLWTELHAGWQAFESTRRVPAVRIADDGRYMVTSRG